MPVITKETHNKLVRELNDRFGYLAEKLDSRSLSRASEGCKRGSWIYPDDMVATKGSQMDLSLAIDDFKNILAIIRKLK